MRAQDSHLGALLANQNSYYRKNQKEHRRVVIEVIKAWLRQEEEIKRWRKWWRKQHLQRWYEVGVSASSV